MSCSWENVFYCSILQTLKWLELFCYYVNLFTSQRYLCFCCIWMRFSSFICNMALCFKFKFYLFPTPMPTHLNTQNTQILMKTGENYVRYKLLAITLVDVKYWCVSNYYYYTYTQFTLYIAIIRIWLICNYERGIPGVCRSADWILDY